jgi:murein DD-endopeptidase MepM/ murein hydrolase activator NlpD
MPVMQLWRRAIPGVAGLLLIAATSVPGFAADANAEDSRQGELERAIGEAGEAEQLALAELDRLHAAKESAIADLGRLDVELVRASQAVLDAEAEAEAATARHVELQFELDDRERDARRALGRARSSVVDLYVSGDGTDALESVFVFLSEDFESAAAQSQYLEHVNAVRRGALDDAEEAVTAVGRLTRAAERERQIAAAAIEEAEDIRGQIATLREHQASVRAQLERAEADELRAIEHIRAEKGRYEDELVRITAESGSITQLLADRQRSQIRGELVVTRPVPGAIVSEFGMRVHPILGTKRLHQGVDMDAAYGRPIVAAAAGVVVVAAERGGYGNCTIIDHGNQYATLYAHQSRFALSVGDRVEAGDVIGYVGNTGLSTGPHLHFEIRRLGIPTNPRPFLD